MMVSGGIIPERHYFRSGIGSQSKERGFQSNWFSRHSGPGRSTNYAQWTIYKRIEFDVQGLVVQSLLPEHCRFGKCRSLYLQGFHVCTTGISTRPQFAAQSRVYEMLHDYLTVGLACLSTLPVQDMHATYFAEKTRYHDWQWSGSERNGRTKKNKLAFGTCLVAPYSLLGGRRVTSNNSLNKIRSKYSKAIDKGTNMKNTRKWSQDMHTNSKKTTPGFCQNTSKSGALNLKAMSQNKRWTLP